MVQTCCFQRGYLVSFVRPLCVLGDPRCEEFVVLLATEYPIMPAIQRLPLRSGLVVGQLQTSAPSGQLLRSNNNPIGQQKSASSIKDEITNHGNGS